MHVKIPMQYYAFDVATTLLFSSAENKLSPCFKAWMSIGMLLALKSWAERTLSRSSASSVVILRM
jgi:hypothetical protein